MPSTLKNITLPADTWVNLYANQAVIDAGITVGDQLIITHIKGEVELNFEATKPLQDSGFVGLPDNGFKNNEIGALGAWAISRGRSGLINVNTVEGVIAKFDSLVEKRVRTTGMTFQELMTFEGWKFQSTLIKTIANAGNAYIHYKMPPIESGVIVALQERRFKTESGGADLEIWWNSTDIVIPGAALPTFNENRNSSNVAQMVIKDATSITEVTLREIDFIASTGVGANSSGGISSGSGFRIYSPDSDFVANEVNNHNTDNRFMLAYTWLEIPITCLALA